MLEGRHGVSQEAVFKFIFLLIQKKVCLYNMLTADAQSPF